MRVIIDRQRCAGTGMCESLAPQVFEVEDDGVLKLLQEQPGADQAELVRAAAEACPFEAIFIVD